MAGARFLAWLQRILADDRVVAWTVAFTALLTFPVVFQGFQADDHALRGLSLHLPPWDRWAGGPLDLFTFYDGHGERTTSLVDHGFAPWWTDTDLRIRFFRPLAAATHWIDFRVGPPAFAHAQSLVWYLGVVAVVGALYRVMLGARWVAGFAVLLFAVDYDHGVPIAFVSHRNALLAAFAGVLAILALDRARRAASWRFTLIAAACLALALAGGESALGAAAYLAAYALFYDERSVRVRAASIAPCLVVLVLWAILYRACHYGAHGSGLYLDPIDDPGAFLRAASANVPLLLQTELAGVPPDVLLFFFGGVPAWALGLAAVALGVAALAFAPLLGDRRARFFLAGSILATVPAAATYPSGRLLLMPSIGLLGLVAMVVEDVLDARRRSELWRAAPVRAAAVLVAAWTGGVHLFLSPLLLELALQQMPALEQSVERFSDGLGDDPALAGQRVVVVNPPHVFYAFYMMALRITAGRAAPGRTLALASGRRGVEVERTDARTLLVRPDGGFFRGQAELLTRGPHAPMSVGARVELTGLTVEVTRADDVGVPTEAAFRFAVELEDAALDWVAWRGRTLVPFDLPRVGEKRYLAAQALTF